MRTGVSRQHWKQEHLTLCLVAIASIDWNCALASAVALTFLASNGSLGRWYISVWSRDDGTISGDEQCGTTNFQSPTRMPYPDCPFFGLEVTSPVAVLRST